ncbi:MAG: hypothetical protein M3173_04290 [Chloroflexota bacterium]|nr:hypothetical protein [Chloroflexota bacterium]
MMQISCVGYRDVSMRRISRQAGFRFASALLTVLILSLGPTAPATAQESPVPGIAEYCRNADEDRWTRGESLNWYASFATGNGNRWIVGFCGVDSIEEYFRNQGQCVSSFQQK